MNEERGADLRTLIESTREGYWTGFAAAVEMLQARLLERRLSASSPERTDGEETAVDDRIHVCKYCGEVLAGEHPHGVRVPPT